MSKSINFTTRDSVNCTLLETTFTELLFKCYHIAELNVACNVIKNAINTCSLQLYARHILTEKRYLTQKTHISYLHI